MRSLSPVLVLAIVLMRNNGTSARSLRGSSSAEWPLATGRGPTSFSELTVAKRTDLTDILPENHNPCISLRGNDEQRQLLCNDRRSPFNYNPFGLRFGKRFLPVKTDRLSQGSLARPRTITFLPVFLNPRDLEITT
ncbi:unnamed protein product [Arctogadus glacialis]|uniref:Kisspeptin 2 n=1 Tax=Gadus morhua TaxID=8049 RepID=A0A8C4YZB1_GADMO|nr:kisspeptin 2 [Gadus chalcogrammus]XP_059904753.1 kisspeptin 2 [Gadus macrocephalus]